MKTNKLGFMSLIALLGILGVITENKGMIGFLGFLYYIRYFLVVPDEMFIQNVHKSGNVGFFSGISVTCVAIAIRCIWPNVLSSVMAFATGFIVSVGCFTLALLYCEYKERKG